MRGIVSREAWNARLPLATLPLQSPADYVVCMATNSYPCCNDPVCKFTVRLLQRFHMTKKRMMDIRYNFLIGENGGVYEGRGWTSAPLLPTRFKKINDKTILIGCIGSFTEDTLPESISKAREELIAFGISHNYIKEDCKRWQIFEPKPEEEPSINEITNLKYDNYVVNQST